MSSVTVADRRTRSLLRAPVAARRRGRAWLVVLVGALVAGIFGMHALASHGAPGPTARPVAADVGAAPGGTAHEGHAHADMQGATATSGAGSDDGSGHHMSSMVMLCVVMLAAAAVTLLGLLARGLRVPRLPDAFAPAAVRTSVHRWVRGAGPPPEWQFSVIRC